MQLLSFVHSLPSSGGPPPSPGWQVSPKPEIGIGKISVKVLVVDDNEDAVVLLAKLLGVFGHDARFSTSGIDALEVGAVFEPDVVVLDLGMPGMDGIETARRLKQEPWGERAILIALTGWGQPEDLERTRAAGFDAHLVKPLEIDRLLDLLKKQEPM
jgi:CheY-like chemotaxis protein